MDSQFLGKYVIARTHNAGVFAIYAGYLDSKNGSEIVLRQARRIWRFSGAVSIYQLAQSGTSNPQECKFHEEVDLVLLTETIEILLVSEQAKQSINEVPIWKD